MKVEEEKEKRRFLKVASHGMFTNGKLQICANFKRKEMLRNSSIEAAHMCGKKCTLFQQFHRETKNSRNQNREIGHGPYFRPHLTGPESLSEVETSWKDSRSQKLTHLSWEAEASRNSCGWNSTSWTGPACSWNSVINLPARRSQI